ncbi:hypothetical protein H257_18483 [Aphanomyces astaci]|uniref:Uncharacterized protein n=1 Tax=Aphanomyces astaci TaxID=112090 RepID=W4FCN0_APHAT|nr:hypothetical protein H257_18483 [Aphanomyces astaci]ETV64649.1 hypothetical protein H257_18483 [Aphanomyces astaci]|eukprot:XP_009845845.1 hypothetical protein H257_18483 [Aphanomyces astaci]
MVRSATGRELTDDERTALYHRLLQLKKNGRVSSGDIKELMRTFHVSQQTISHILLRGCQTAAETGCAKVASRKKGRCVSTMVTAYETSSQVCRRTDDQTSVHWLLQPGDTQDFAVESHAGQQASPPYEPCEAHVVRQAKLRSLQIR